MEAPGLSHVPLLTHVFLLLITIVLEPRVE